MCAEGLKGGGAEAWAGAGRVGAGRGLKLTPPPSDITGERARGWSSASGRKRESSERRSTRRRSSADIGAGAGPSRAGTLAAAARCPHSPSSQLPRRPGRPAGRPWTPASWRRAGGCERAGAGSPRKPGNRAAGKRGGRGWVGLLSPLCVELEKRGSGARRRGGHDSCNLRRAPTEPLSRRGPDCGQADRTGPARPGPRRRLTWIRDSPAGRPAALRLRLPGRCPGRLDRSRRGPSRRTPGPRWLGWGLRAPLDAGGDSRSA